MKQLVTLEVTKIGQPSSQEGSTARALAPLLVLRNISDVPLIIN